MTYALKRTSQSYREITQLAAIAGGRGAAPALHFFVAPSGCVVVDRVCVRKEAPKLRRAMMSAVELSTATNSREREVRETQKGWLFDRYMYRCIVDDASRQSHCINGPLPPP